MYQAVSLAEKGRRLAHPNPMVGAVIVKRGTIIASGHHERFGGPHAEVNAIKKAGTHCKGATLYVTLEPCSTFGKTPPCVDAIVHAGFTRVIVGAMDPNPLHNGRGIRKLRRAGITVVTGILKDVVERQNEAFFTKMRTGRPFVTVKLAMSLDGKIATADGDSRWISSADSRKIVHELRAQSDAVLIGVKTCVVDNARLTVRGIGGTWREPYKVVIDPELRLPATAMVLKKNAPGSVIVFTAVKDKDKRFMKYQRRGINVRFIRSQHGYLSIPAVLEALNEFNIMSVLVEGGSGIVGSFFDAKLVDKICFFVAPKIIGGQRSINAVGGKGRARIRNAFVVKDLWVEKVGEDHVFVGYPTLR